MRDYPLDFFLTPMKPAKPPKTVSGAKRLEEAFKSASYIAEEKMDGCRYFSIGGRMFSPRISDVDGIPVEKTQQVAHIAEVLSNFGDKLILDGEIYFPGGKAQDVITVTGSLPDVALAKQQESGNWLRYAIFDVLRDANGRWLVDLPWWKRRKYLEELYEKLQGTHVDLLPIIIENKHAYLDTLLEQGKEGIVLKHMEAPYAIGKRPAWQWIKCKVENEDDVVIMGFEPPERVYTGKYPENWTFWARKAGELGSLDVHIIAVREDEIIINGRRPGPEWVPVTKFYAYGWIGSIVFGKYDSKGNLVRLGTCSGIDEAMRARFSEHPEHYIGKVMRVRLMELTRDHAYRHCRFDGIHADKNPQECKV